MTQRLVTVAALAAMALVPVVTAQAVERAASTAAVTKAAPTRAVKGQHMTAKVTSVNAQAKTLTVRRGARHEVTFAVAPEAAGSLADLKPGERVRITYERSAGKLTAQSIAPMAHATAK